MPANRITNFRLSKITLGQEDILCYTKNKKPKDRIILYESYLIQFWLKHFFLRKRLLLGMALLIKQLLCKCEDTSSNPQHPRF